MTKTLTTKLPENNPIYLKNYPDYTRWDADIDVFPLAKIWDDAVAKYPHHDVIAYMGATITYTELNYEIQKMNARLQKLGVKKGTHVGIFMGNSPWFVITYQAILQLGGVIVNYNPLYTPDELEHQITDSKTEVMVTMDSSVLTDKLCDLVGVGDFTKMLICPLGADPSDVPTSDSVVNFISIGDDLPAPARYDSDTDVEDLAVLQYTGGTTGRAKGAALSHKNISANVSMCQQYIHGFEEGKERVATFLPLFHVFAMTVCMHFNISRGGCMVMLPKFEINDALNIMKKQQGTMLIGVPTMYHTLTLVSDEDRTKLSTMKFAISGGAGLPEVTKTKFEQQTGVEVIEGYGLSETSPVVCLNPFNGQSKADCIGKPVPHTEVSLRDLEDPEKQVPDGERGEVCVRGPQVMMGYWNNSDATHATMTKDGFLRTGDVAMFDENGFCYIVDRIKDIILCGGFNVYPKRIEDAILQHPDVEEVIVIGIPDAHRGEKPMAFVTMNDDATTTESEILTFANAKLSKIEQFKDIQFRDDLPTTAVGKLSKKDLRDELEAEKT